MKCKKRMMKNGCNKRTSGKGAHRAKDCLNTPRGGNVPSRIGQEVRIRAFSH
nr:MAG TPA: hypothetical protein [Caudoviricetes sp.]